MTAHPHLGQMLRISEATLTHLHGVDTQNFTFLIFFGRIRYIRIQKDYQPTQPDARSCILTKTVHSLIGDFIKLSLKKADKVNIHSLVFSLRGRAGRNQSPVM